MGRVYACHLGPSSRELAVKVLARDTGAYARDLFVREAHHMADVDSPYVPRMLELVEDDEDLAIVMERAYGDDLVTYGKKHGALERDDVASIVSQVAFALTAAHDAGIVHADVKAENVVVEGHPGDLHARLVDFGISRRICDTEPELDTDSVPSGTLAAMSPEQILQPWAPRPAWDVWALACLAFACLTGQKPHEGTTLAAVLLSTMNGSRPRASSLRADVGDELDLVFDKAFAEAVIERFQTARELADALASALR